MYKINLLILISFLIQGCCGDCGEKFYPCEGVRKGFIKVPDSCYTYYPFAGDSFFTLRNQKNYKISYLSVPILKDSFQSYRCDSFFTKERISKTFIPDKTGMQISYEWSEQNKLIIRIGDMVFRLDSTRDNPVKYHKEVKVDNNLTVYNCYTIEYKWIARLYYSKSRGILALGENYNLWKKM